VAISGGERCLGRGQVVISASRFASGLAGRIINRDRFELEVCDFETWSQSDYEFGSVSSPDGRHRSHKNAIAECRLALSGSRFSISEVSERLSIDGANLLLLIDQSEDLFRCSDHARRDKAEAFVALILEGARQTAVPIYVVLTMRSDFLGTARSLLVSPRPYPMDNTIARA
jgi:hypothetical protein